MRIITLVENSVTDRSLLAEHGLSFYIEAGRSRILFDTGQTELLLHNARHLAISLQNVDAVILSHGHYDHTGGLSAVLKLSPQAKVFHHPAATAPKFARTSDGKTRSIGMAPLNLQALVEHHALTIQTQNMTEIGDGIFVTGEIPRETSYETTGGKFFLDEACVHPDLLLDDQSLFFSTPQGVVVILGCAHSGIVNTLNYIHKLTGGRPIHAIIGGLHLLSANAERVQQTIEVFRHYQVQQLVPGHCTGMSAVVQLWSAFPGRCFSCSVGARFLFPTS